MDLHFVEKGLVNGSGKRHRAIWTDIADTSDPVGKLRSCHHWPRSRRAAGKCDKFPPPHGAYPKAKDHGLSIAGLGASSGPCTTAKAGPYLLTHPGQFDILVFGPGWRGSDAIRSTTSARGAFKGGPIYE